MPDRELIDRLAAGVEEAFERVIPRDSRCAILNFPIFPNPGDAAIWLGQLAILDRLRVATVYECEWRTYSPRALENALDDQTIILLNGGGNFGDLYIPGGQQSVRERVLEEFCGHRMVQLPQSIHFEQRENLVRVKRLVERHGAFTLFVREEQSFRRAKSAFDVPVVLCPDSAFALSVDTGLARSPDRELVWLARNDKEKTFTSPTPNEGLLVVDWVADDLPSEETARVAAASNQALLHRMIKDESVKVSDWRALAATFEPLARDRVARALSTLRRGRVIVTERLHGHILAFLLGLPHIVLDNSYGKTKSLYDTWTSLSRTARFAGSAEEALAMAREEAARTRGAS
jgi:exopolysaccharide biosynthesis predicted pyruvyltransferase EpsI